MKLEKFLSIAALVVLVLLMLPTPPAHAAWSIGSKQCQAFANGTTTVTCTWGTALAAGDSPLCWVGGFTSRTITVADSAGNNYTNDAGTVTDAGTGGTYAHFSFMPVAGSVTTVTVTFSGSMAFSWVNCDAGTGGKASSPADGTSSGTGTSTGNWTTGSITTTANGDVLHCGTIIIGGGTLSVGTGYTVGTFPGGANNPMNQYLVQSVAGSITPNWNSSGSGDRSAAVCAALKAAPAVSVVPAQRGAAWMGGF